MGIAALVLASKESFATPPALSGFVSRNSEEDPGNFRSIYLDDRNRESFRNFLVNVYHLYPETEFHDLIHRCARDLKTDGEIYAAIQKAIPSIKPFLGDLFYSLPALFKQKDELARETLELIDWRVSGGKSIDGYLEIGTTGRYISELKSRAPVSGDLVLLHTTAPSWSPVDIAERGGLAKVGRFVPLLDYRAIPESEIPSNHLDVVANYIGFHHCPLDRLETFVDSVCRVLKKGGSLVLRDHDVDSPVMNSVVSLAHDVFNAGLMTPWSVNHAELRHFRSLDQWITYLDSRGLKFQG
ncbi:MAG: methyltransferase domain-containing protein, partial [Proteobacteria bacterium]|nr:methyltransferase domain-containing protein [Pseudomonadota bacterium]